MHNVGIIKMPQETAREKLRMYRRRSLNKLNEEYRAALLGYEALAKGTPLVSLSQVFTSAILDDKGYPKLAIARADRKQVYFRMSHYQDIVFSTRKISSPKSINLDLTYPVRARSGHLNGYALVPMIPIEHKPKGKLSDYLILWEVEHWSERRLTAEPDTDPLLLKQVVGDIYAVHAAWDLTELEKAIMSNRRFA